MELVAYSLCLNLRSSSCCDRSVGFLWRWGEDRIEVFWKASLTLTETGNLIFLKHKTGPQFLPHVAVLVMFLCSNYFQDFMLVWHVYNVISYVWCNSVATHGCVCFLLLLVFFMCSSGVKGDVGTLRHCEMVTTVFLGHPSPQLLIQSPPSWGCLGLDSSVLCNGTLELSSLGLWLWIHSPVSLPYTLQARTNPTTKQSQAQMKTTVIIFSKQILFSFLIHFAFYPG